METQTIPQIITHEVVVEQVKALSEQKKKPILVGVSGLGGSGKSTLAQYLRNEIAGSAYVEIDDFYKTADERKGDNVSKSMITDKIKWDEIDEKIFRAMERGRDIHFHQCRRELGGHAKWIFHPVDRVVILEGIYAFQDRFIGRYDYRIWVETPADVRLRRGVARDGESSRADWENIWMPQDQRYFDHDRPDVRADAIIYGI